MTDFISTLAELNRLKATLAELTNRVYGLQIGVVTDNQDPLNLRRIKVAPQSKGGVATSEWLGHCNPDPGRDAPIPLIGSTVYYQFLDGDPHDGVWIGVTHNDTNPPDSLQSDPVNDSATEIPGCDRRTVIQDAIYQVGGDRTDEVSKSFQLKVDDELHITTDQGEVTVTANQNMVTITGKLGVRLEDGSGAFIEVAGGVIRIGNAQGQDWQLGGGTGNVWRWDCNGGTIEIINANDVTINDSSNSVVVLGGRDSDNDVLVYRGY